MSETFAPCPKPSPREKRKPAPLPRMRPKKMEAFKLSHGGRFPGSTITAPKKPVKKRNAKRRETEFARTFHSRERVAFVKALRCFATGQFGTAGDPIDNAHVCDDGSKGMGRRSGYACIAPLKRSAHRLLHTNPTEFYRRYGPFDWPACAEWTENEWQKNLASGGQ